MNLICPQCYAENRPGEQYCQQCHAELREPTSHLLLPGTLLNQRYLVTRVIASGGMGVIYEARAQNLDNLRCAIKALDDRRLPPADLEESIRNFQREGSILAHLKHPNLPRVFDNFAERGEHYLVMDFVEGESLENYLERTGHKPVPFDQAMEWTVELCDVLGYLHKQKPPIIFRDLKPGNIMINPEGQMKLVDFGIARFFVPGKPKDTQAYGTPGYSAPEQYGKEQTDARSDVYALGVILHELLTGHDPSNTPFHLPPVRQLNPDLSSGVEAVIQKATRTSPELRYQNIDELQKALVGITRQPVSQQPTSRGPQPSTAQQFAPRQSATRTAVKPPENGPGARTSSAAKPAASGPTFQKTPPYSASEKKPYSAKPPTFDPTTRKRPVPPSPMPVDWPWHYPWFQTANKKPIFRPYIPPKRSWARPAGSGCCLWVVLMIMLLVLACCAIPWLLMNSRIQWIDPSTTMLIMGMVLG